MRSIAIVSFLMITIASCATHSGYETFQAREKEYDVSSIALQEGGLTSEQIESIKCTELAADFPIDISLILIKNGYIESDREKILIGQLIGELQKYEKIARVIPVPAFLIPQKIDFAKIQELGIRTMSEYVLILYVNAETLFKWTVILETEYEIESIVDFLLVDSQTTAIIATDKLYSSVLYRANIFKPGEKEKAEGEIFSEQAEILGRKMRGLFN
jgi:hypothetical protein